MDRSVVPRVANSNQISNGSAPVRAVVFDLFNTLTAPVDDAAFKSARIEMARAVGADPGAFSNAWSAAWRERYDGTNPTVQACVRGVCEAIGVRAHETAIDEASRIRIECTRRALRPRPDALVTLAQLRALGLRTALVSNCIPEVPLIWPTTPYAEAIDEPLFSCDEGLTKPDPTIYLRACERLRVDPRDCAYVGDGAQGELSGAQRVGMRTILITTPGRPTPEYSEQESWRGESIDALSELPGLISGARIAAAD